MMVEDHLYSKSMSSLSPYRSLLPSDGGPPKFIQLYIYDKANEVHNQLKCLSPHVGMMVSLGCLEPSIVAALMKMLDYNNPFAKKLRTARERLRDYLEEDFIIRILGDT
jgi:hypothetical protein